MHAELNVLNWVISQKWKLLQHLGKMPVNSEYVTACQPPKVQLKGTFWENIDSSLLYFIMWFTYKQLIVNICTYITKPTEIVVLLDYPGVKLWLPEVGSNEVQVLWYFTWVVFSVVWTLLESFFFWRLCYFLGWKNAPVTFVFKSVSKIQILFSVIHLLL